MTQAAIEKQPSTSGTAPERIDQGEAFAPRVDIYETGDAFVFQSDVPGVKAGDIDIDYDDGVFTIHAKVKPRQGEDQQYALQEYGVGDFRRSFGVGAGIKAEAVRAELANGVLTVTVPKAESARTRKIPIKTG